MRCTRRAALPAAILAIVVLAACVPFKPGAPAAAPLPFGSAHPQAQELYYIVNNERAANGLGPVAWHDQLGGLAQGWSDYMAVSGNYSHRRRATRGDPLPSAVRRALMMWTPAIVSAGAVTVGLGACSGGGSDHRPASPKPRQDFVAQAADFRNLHAMTKVRSFYVDNR